LFKETASNGLIRVVTINAPVNGKSARAVECCCGTHVLNTRDLGAFVVVSDRSLGSGVRRLTALTGTAARLAIEKGMELRTRLGKLNSDSHSGGELIRFEKVGKNEGEQQTKRCRMLKIVKEACEKRKDSYLSTNGVHGHINWGRIWGDRIEVPCQIGVGFYDNEHSHGQRLAQYCF
uniref:tRNA_SAD domain-containing protein n=1 Tax=Ascaris lumbricoides TaxID=6252 RepID=A0A0M3HF85_ASCLU